jgi:hypothetical protein
MCTWQVSPRMRLFHVTISSVESKVQNPKNYPVSVAFHMVDSLTYMHSGFIIIDPTFRSCNTHGITSRRVLPQTRGWDDNTRSFLKLSNQGRLRSSCWLRLLVSVAIPTIFCSILSHVTWGDVQASRDQFRFLSSPADCGSLVAASFLVWSGSDSILIRHRVPVVRTDVAVP